MLPSHLHAFINNNILTSTEAAEILNITRQRVTALVKEKELIPVKVTSQGMLFLRADVEALKNAKEIGYNIIKRNSVPLYDGAGSTTKSIEFFKQHQDKLDQITEVSIYFNDLDAAVDKYYIESEFMRYGELKTVETPSMVIRSRNGTEIWLGACTCGYGGTGPGGSRKVLQMLQETEKLKGLKHTQDELCELLWHRVVKIIVDSDGNTEIFKHDSIINNISGTDISAHLYLFRNNLVLIQESDDVKIQHLGILQKYSAFIPRPDEVILFHSDEQAREHGYINLTSNWYNNEEQSYRLIIRDASGRELWLIPSIDKGVSLHSQPYVKEVLEVCGFEIPTEKDSVPTKFLNWFNEKLVKVPPSSFEPLRFNKKKI